MGKLFDMSGKQKQPPPTEPPSEPEWRARVVCMKCLHMTLVFWKGELNKPPEYKCEKCGCENVEYSGVVQS